MRKHRRKMRMRWIDFAFSIAIISLTIAAIYIIASTGPAHETAEAPQSVHKTAAAKVKSTNSSYKGIKIVTETSNEAEMPYAIQYPQSEHAEFNKEVETYISGQRNKFLNSMAILKDKKPDGTGELNISFETMKQHSGQYSFVIVTSSNFSDSTFTFTIRSFHLDPVTGAMPSIADVFGRNPQHLKTVSTLVEEALRADQSISGKLSEDKMNIHLSPVWKNFSDYAITDEEMIFYLHPSIVMDAKNGPAIISLPLQSLESLLESAYRPLIEQQKTGETGGENESADEIVEKEKPTHENKQTNEESAEETDTNEDTTKKVALTFDDGPDPKVTPQILATLEKHNAKATFFMLGSRVEYYPDIAKSVKEAGHELGNHTWNHASLPKLKSDRILREIKNTSAIIEQVTGGKATVFRPPYGAVNERVRSLSDLPVILWNVDTQDWKNHDPSQILSKVKEHTRDGSIILLHDIHQATADGLDDVLSYLESQGYTFVTVSELD